MQSQSKQSFTFVFHAKLDTTSLHVSVFEQRFVFGKIDFDIAELT